MKMKICTKCHEEKSLSEFTKDKTKRDGLYSSCKKCRHVEGAQYYLKNKPRFKNNNHQYYLSHKKEHYAICRSYINAHPEKSIIYRKRYKEKVGIESMREYDKKRQRKERKNLSDLYIKMIINQNYGIKYRDIPYYLIALKRKRIQLYRFIKQTKEYIKEMK